MALPNFLVIGFAKSGTTSLCSYLNEHPQIYMGGKEIDFFGAKFDPARLAHYEFHYFQSYNDEQVIGEGSVAYANCLDLDIAQQVKDTLGDQTKIIACLRHPVRRIFSDYQMVISWFLETRSFEALAHEALRTGKPGKFINFGLHAPAIQCYHKHFGRDQIHTLVFEQSFAIQDQNKINTTLDFLNVERQKAPAFNQHKMKGGLPKVMFVPKGAQNLKLNGQAYIPQTNIAIVTEHFGTDEPLNRIVKNPSQNFINHIKTLDQNVTTTLSPELEGELFEKFFKEDTKKCEDLLNQDLMKIWHP